MGAGGERWRSGGPETYRVLQITVLLARMAGQHEQMAAMLERMRWEQEELGDREAELAGWEEQAAGEGKDSGGRRE